VRLQQPVQRGDVAEVEQLELRHHLQLLAELVQLGDERPGVEEDVVAEVDRAHGQRARVGRCLEHPQPLLVRVVDRASGRQLHDQAGRGAQRGHRLGEPGQVERGPVLVVADVHVHQAGPGGLAAHRGLDQLVERGRQRGHVGLGGLRPGGCDGDQGACCR
jgi:hypothetical protein